MSDRPTAANRQAFVGTGAIVTPPTRLRAPVLASSMPEPGPHINAVGAISPERMEQLSLGRAMPHCTKAQPDLQAATPVRTA